MLFCRFYDIMITINTREVSMKNITVAICLDDKGGMTIFGKRQSRDRVLISELCDSVDGIIYISEFSKALFAPHEDRYRVSDDPLTECPDGGVCFIEDLALMPHLSEIETLLLYKWNRVYPSDKRIDIPLDGFRVIEEHEFTGSSHDKITKLTMRRK